MTVASVLQKSKMDPSLLVLEITESCFVEDSDRTVGVLVDLKSFGVRLALDNFGSSYSGLRQLTRLAIDVIKIDRMLVANICHDPTNRAIVGAVVNLAHSLGLTVVAGGIETQNQRDEARGGL